MHANSCTILHIILLLAPLATLSRTAGFCDVVTARVAVEQLST